MQVCLDPLAVSSDPTRAFLMDGHVVAAWVDKAFSQLRAQVEAAGTTQSAAPAVLRAAAAVHDLWTVTCALQGEAPGRSDRGLLGGLCRGLLLWRQYLDALAWLLTARVPPPRHVGPGAWATAVAKRRDAAQHGSLFLDDLLQAAGRPAYPQPDAGVAAKAFFLHGARFRRLFDFLPLIIILTCSKRAGETSDEALVAKAGLFYYYLLDAGAPGSTDAASYAASCGQLTGQAPPLSHNFASQVRAGYLLDESCERPVALDRAGALLACGACGGSSTPLQFVSELLHRGAYGWALDVMHARRGGRVADDLDEAVAWVTTCLHGGHLHHAFAHAQLLCESIADPKERKHASTQLVQLIGAHCKDRGALGQLIALPWSCPEEEVLAQWLLSEAADGSLTGEAFPALYACRRRWSEAAHAHATLQKVDASLGGPGATLPVELRSIKQRLAEARSAMMAQHVPPALAAAAAHTLVTQPVAGLDGLPPSPDDVAPPPPMQVLLGSDAQAAETLSSAVGGAPPASWALRSVRVGATGMPVLVGPPPATWAAMRAASARHALFAAAASPEQQQQRPADAEMAGPDMQLFDNALPVMRLDFDAMRAPGGEQRGRVDDSSRTPTGAPSLAPAPPPPRGAQSLLFGRTATTAGQDTQTAHGGGGDSTAAFSTRRASRAAAAFDVAAAGASEQSLLRALAAGATPRREMGGTPKRPRRSTASYARAE